MQAKRKLTALLLSLCMVLGVLPMTAFAAERLQPKDWYMKSTAKV